MAKSKIATNEFIETITAALQKKSKPRISAQSLFATVSEKADYSVNARNMTGVYTAIKPLIEALVLAEVVRFRYVENGTSFYEIPSIPSDGAGIKPAGQGTVRKNWRLRGDSLHSQAMQAIAKHVFITNRAHLAIAEEKNYSKLVFHKGVWLTKEEYIPTEEDGLKYSDLLDKQLRMIASHKAMLEKYPQGWSFDVYADDRGRVYYAGGYASPHCGSLARYLYTLEGQVTCDHRTSFAQNFSLLTGSKIGQWCGVGVDHDTDFWVNALAHYGLTIKPHSAEREIAKRYGMPTFYGAGKARATESADEVAGEFLSRGKLSKQRYEELLKALDKLGDDLRDFSERARTFAKSWVDIGEHPQWETPSGFHAEKHYWTHLDKVWNSGTNETWAYPKSMTSRLETRRICERSDKEKGDKSVLVATGANLLQSIDASILTRACLKFYNLMGYTPYVIHDSYTIEESDRATLEKCVIESMIETADSEQMQVLRRELSLPPVKVIIGKRKGAEGVRNLDLRKMNPLDIE